MKSSKCLVCNDEFLSKKELLIHNRTIHASTEYVLYLFEDFYEEMFVYETRKKSFSSTKFTL